MRKLLLIIFLLSSIVSISQTKNQKQEIDSLLNLSRNGLFSIDLVSVLKNSQNAFQKSKEINYSQGKARASYYIANALLETGNYKSALEYLSFSLQENYTKNTPQLITDIYRVRGRAYGNMGLSGISIAEFKKALKSAEQIAVSENRKYTKSLLYENLIFSYQKKEMMDSVKHYLDQNKLVMNDLKEDFIFRNKINYHNYLAEYYTKLTKYDSAILNLKKSIQITEKYPHPYTSETYKLWGNIKYIQKQLDSGLFYYFKAVKNIEKTGLKNELPPIYKSIASIYKLQENKGSAQNYRLKSMEIQQKITLGKTEANETVLKTIIDEKSNQISQKSYTLVIVLSVISTLLIGLIIFYFRKKQQRTYSRILTKRKLLNEKDKIIHQKEEETNQLKLQVNEAFDGVIQLAKDNHPEFIVRFSEVYPQQYKRLLDIRPKLLNAEIKFCAMLYLNFSTKDIAEYTFVTVKAVQHRKFRMRKKLNIPSDVDILEWLNNN